MSADRRAGGNDPVVADGRRSGGAAWWVAARLARREVRRRPGRSALVTAVVAVPVAGMLFGVAYQRTTELSAAESWRLSHGRADAVVHGEPGLPPVTDLPEGSRSVDVATSYRIAEAETGLCRCVMTDMPFEPITDGMVQVTEGRAPQAAGEVLLSPGAATAFSVGRGDRLSLTRPVDAEVMVVGIGLAGPWSDDALVALGPGVELPADEMSSVARLVDLPEGMTSAELAAWEQTTGPHSMSPAYPATMSPWISDSNQNMAVRWTWVAGAVGLTVLGIVIAAAFAAGARRQLATLGQLAANGATPAGLRRVLFLQGTVTGLIGTAAGLALGAGVLVALRPRLALLVDHAVPGWEVRLLDVLPIVVIAVVAATVAAMVPARGASRVSVLTALAGRRPLGRVSRRHTFAGLAVAATGLGCLGAVAWAGRDGLSPDSVGLLSVAAVAGPVLLLLGTCAAAPAYLTVLRPVAAAARGPWRLAARSLFRQRTRTSALVAAIAALSALAVATAGVGLQAEREVRHQRRLDQLPSDLVLVEAGTWLADLVRVLPRHGSVAAAADRAGRLLPEAERLAFREAVAPGATVAPSVTVWKPQDGGGESGAMPRGITVADGDFRRAFAVDDVTEQALRRYGAVWTGPAGDDRAGDSDEALRVEAVTYAETSDPAVVAGYVEPPVVSTTEFEAVPIGPDHAFGFGSGGQVIVTPERAEELGFEVVATGAVLRSPQPLTADEVDDLQRLALGLEADHEQALATLPPGAPEPPGLRVDFREPSFYAGPAFLEAVPAGVALLFTLFVVAAGLALAAAETRDERTILLALGAAPRTVRRTSAYKAFLLTLLGGGLAVPLGLVPVHVYTRLGTDPAAVPFPWRTVATLVVAVPLVAALAAALASWAGARWGRPAPGGAVGAA